MRQNIAVFGLALIFAVVALGLSMRAGVLANLSPQILWLSTAPKAAEGAVGVGVGQTWGIFILLPLPFLLIGLIGFLLYRSSTRSARYGSKGRSK